MGPRAKAAGYALVLAALTAGADQYLKGLVEQAHSRNESLPRFSDWLELTFTNNHGTAFGMLQHAPVWVVLGISIAILGVFSALIWPHLFSRLGVAIAALVLGGALGNIIDRFRFQSVRDYLHFHIGTAFDWPIFNLADICVVVGVGLLILKLLRTTDK